MSFDPGSLVRLITPLAIAASGVGAFLGGYTLMHPSGSRALTGLTFDAAAPGGARVTGGALLLGHAAALATLAQAPGIGACMAAGLGSMWFGAAAGRAIATVVERRRNLSMLARIAAEAAMGLMLWAPLWRYLRLIRHAAEHGAV